MTVYKHLYLKGVRIYIVFPKKVFDFLNLYCEKMQNVPLMHPMTNQPVPDPATGQPISMS